MSNSKVCIYTAICGGYDDLKEQPKQTIDCDFVCFSDTITEDTKGWKVYSKPGNPKLHPRLRAKYFKLMSHKLFNPPQKRIIPFFKGKPSEQYAVTIWIDGSLKIRSSRFAEEMVAFLDRYGMAMFIHPDRSCIYDEVDFCWDFPKYREFPLREQIAHYRKQGYPVKNGLMAAGIIVRNTLKKELHHINKAWWRENLRWTYQDQLSLPYVLWKEKYGYDPIKLNLWDNHLFEIVPHHSEL